MMISRRKFFSFFALGPIVLVAGKATLSEKTEEVELEKFSCEWTGYSETIEKQKGKAATFAREVDRYAKDINEWITSQASCSAEEIDRYAKWAGKAQASSADINRQLSAYAQWQQ